MTLQNINLYLPEFRLEKFWLDARTLVQLTLAAIVLMAAVSGYQYWQLTTVRSELVTGEQQRQAEVAQTAALQASYGDQSEDPALLEDIRQLESGLQAKEALLQFLDGRNLGNSQGFSGFLTDLSRYHLQGLSLTGVVLGEGGATVTLAGQVLQAELVPLYLQNLSKGQSFAGKSFETLNIQDFPADAEAGRPPIWNFEVRSLND